jgi:hypothetical protein
LNFADESDGAVLDYSDSRLDWSDGPVPDGFEGGCDPVALVSGFCVSVEVFIEAFYIDPIDCETFYLLELED